ncbi:hypothetical protein ACEPPN_001369 [Leptodophora sp. 'Broadleaf-Isolate-01']
MSTKHSLVRPLADLSKFQISTSYRTYGPGEATYRGAVEYGVIESKGETISGGAPGLVERLPSGDVVKSPWPGSRAADCRRDMRTENQIYKRLGPHPRLVRMINWDPDECSLTMEYMSNGCLQDYLLAHNDKISMI